MQVNIKRTVKSRYRGKEKSVRNWSGGEDKKKGREEENK